MALPKRRSKKTQANNMAHQAPRARPSGNVVRRCEPPKAIIAAMVAAGAEKDEVEGEDLRLVRIDSVDSRAWQVYKDWACTLGEAEPLVQAIHGPTAAMLASTPLPPSELVYWIRQEATSIVKHLAQLLPEDIPEGAIPELPGPIQYPSMTTTVRHATIAVTTLVETISNPGVKYPLINALQPGTYICHVLYGWCGAYMAVPVFRS